MASQPISVTDATFTLTENHDGVVIALNREEGVEVTLPTSSRSGTMFTILVGTSVKAPGKIVIKPAETDHFVGTLSTHSANSASISEATDGATAITMDGSTTGGLEGSFIQLVDIGPTHWHLRGDLIGEGELVSSLSEAD